MLKEIYNEYSEQHTVGELCVEMLDLRLDMMDYFGKKPPQSYIDSLPQMVLLVNEKRLLALGYGVTIDPQFREDVIDSSADKKQITDGVYYQSLEGCISDIKFTELTP
jgi:hypothetical protein